MVSDFWPSRIRRRDDRDEHQGEQRQQASVAQVVVEVGEKGRRLHVRHLQVGPLQPLHGVPPVVVAAGVALDAAGLDGVAPAVVPWLGGVR